MTDVRLPARTRVGPPATVAPRRRLPLRDRRVRYLLAGGVAAVTYYLIFSVGWLYLPKWLSYLAIAAVANLLTAVLIYPMYRHVVFHTKGPWFTGFLRFYVTAVWALAYALAGLPFLVEILDVHVLVASAIIIVSSPLINYQIHRLWAFRQHRTT